MNYANRQTGWLLATMALVLCSGGTALADDTEIFIAGEDTYADDSKARPNLLFIIDTSGSMRGDVVTQVEWDPSQTFDGCYNSNVVYYSFTSGTPGCSTGNWFPKSSNLCQASKDSMAGLGLYEGDLLAWRVRKNAKRSRWVELNSNQRNRYVECEDDAGKHGWAPGNFYAADGAAGPLATVDDFQPAFNFRYYLFDGNYLNWLRGGGTVTRTRMEIVQEVTNNLLDNLTGVNVGLMRFNNDDGGPVIYAAENIETSREGMQQAISNLKPDGWTPLSETLYEAHQYFAGKAVVYGDGHTYSSVAKSRTGNTSSSKTYKSPIEFGCQKNYVIFLTDGAPTKDQGAESKIEALPDFAIHNGTAAAPVAQCERGEPFEDRNSEPDDAICMDELAGYMHTKDLSDIYGSQTVATYTIGFTLDLDLLKTTAQKGGGNYYLADDTASLSGALTKIAVSILGDAATFSAPSVPVNSFSRTRSLSDTFISVFEPSSTVHWPGNMKKFKLIGGQLIDANGAAAVNEQTGFIRDSAQSYWSPEPDGDRSAEGGVASQLPDYTKRNLYTNISGGDLNSPANRISLANNSLNVNTFSVATTTERDNLINWMNGLDVFDDDDDGDVTDTRRQIGDPLHVSPKPVIYGGTAAAPDMVVFFATNDGIFHAVDADDGTELWSWVPERLLPLMRAKYDDEQNARRMYGLDGTITSTVLNNDYLGGITGDERVILTFGMRRGGDSVFALEVTDRNNPQLLWEVNSGTSGFEDLGQTWSTPQVSRVKIGDKYHDVAIFGGGYDTGQDADNSRTDSSGNAIYMVDLLTGKRLWSAGSADSHDLVLTDMEHSIPAPLRVLDLNHDKLVDRIYVGDMGGRLWRYDIFNGKPLDELGQGGMIASLGAADIGSSTAADVRRFYNQVDVVKYGQDGVPFMILNVGSGYRAHPLDRAINEEFFSVRDFAPSHQLKNDEYGEPVVRDELIDITTTLSADLSKNDSGWRLRMVNSPGEKVLGRSITYSNTIYFTSFAPGSGANACTTAQGINRLYKVDLLTGDPVQNLDESVDEEPSTGDRYRRLTTTGIAPEPIIVATEEGISPCIGVLCEPPEILPVTRSYWTPDEAE